MTGKLSKNFHGVGIGPLSKKYAVKSGHRKMFQRSLWQQQCIVQLWDPNPRSKVSFICFTVIEFCRRQGINMKSQEKAWRYIWGPWGLPTLDIYPISIGTEKSEFSIPQTSNNVWCNKKDSSYILRRPQNFAKSSPYFCPM